MKAALSDTALTAYPDTFARDRLPPRALWPALEFALPELHYPERLNAAAELLPVTLDAIPVHALAPFEV